MILNNHLLTDLVLKSCIGNDTTLTVHDCMLATKQSGAKHYCKILHWHGILGRILIDSKGARSRITFKDCRVEQLTYAGDLRSTSMSHN